MVETGACLRYATARDADRERAWSPYDASLLENVFKNGKSAGRLPIVRWSALLSIFYLAAVLLRLLSHYVGRGIPGGRGLARAAGGGWFLRPWPAALQQVVRHLFGIVAIPLVVSVPFSVILGCVWIVGAAVTDPNKFLSRSAALCALLTSLNSLSRPESRPTFPRRSRGVAPRPVSAEYPRRGRGAAATPASTKCPRSSRGVAATPPPRNIRATGWFPRRWSELRTAAAAKQDRVRDAMRERLRSMLQTWVEEHRGAAVDELGQRAADATAVAREQLHFAESVASQDKAEISMLATTLDVDGSGGISRKELSALVALLDVPEFSSHRVDQVFAYANQDLDDVISPHEFEEAWAWIEDQVVSAALEAAGLTDRFINATLAGACALLLGLFWFVFTVVAAWSDGGSFSAVVESLLVSAASWTVPAAAPKSSRLGRPASTEYPRRRRGVAATRLDGYPRFLQVKSLPNTKKILPEVVVRKGEEKNK